MQASATFAISDLQRARAQAQECRHDLEDEIRILMLHLVCCIFSEWITNPTPVRCCGRNNAGAGSSAFPSA